MLLKTQVLNFAEILTTLKNVNIIHRSKDEADLKILTIQPWNFILGEKCVTNCHAASCSDFIVKMWHTALEIDEEATIFLNYDLTLLVSEVSSINIFIPLPTETQGSSMASESQTLRLKEQIVTGDWVNLRIPFGSQQ